MGQRHWFAARARPPRAGGGWLLLALVLLHDERLVEQAITEALQVERPSKQHVLNCLSRIAEPPRPKPSLPPRALKLVTEPLADTDRYDRLRRKKP